MGDDTVVVPTDQRADPRGIVTRSVLDFFRVEPESVRGRSRAFSSREVVELWSGQYDGVTVQVVASTVFNDAGAYRAEDQWRAAHAALNAARAAGASVLFVPSLGTGAYGWPRDTAPINWLYGALDWTKQNELATEEAPWIVICQPGGVGFRTAESWLDALTGERIGLLEQRRWQLEIERPGLAPQTVQAQCDAPLGVAVNPLVRDVPAHSVPVAVHPSIRFVRRKSDLIYNLGTPLNRTAFADGSRVLLFRDATQAMGWVESASTR